MSRNQTFYTFRDDKSPPLKKKLHKKIYGFFGVENDIQSLLDNEISGHTINKITDEFSVLFVLRPTKMKKY